MPLDEIIIRVFCLVSEILTASGLLLRTRGPRPALTDAEVITMEIVGEMLGIGNDKQIWLYFRRNWLAWFPRLGSRPAFVRQSANLYLVKQKMHQTAARLLGGLDDWVHIIDGFPLPVCRFARAPRCVRFKGDAAYGYCASQKEQYYGFKAVLVVSGSGIPVSISLMPANMDERAAVEETTEGIRGLLMGDKGYISPRLHDDLVCRGLDLQTPLRKNMKDPRDPCFVKLIVRLRRTIETVIGQLTERFDIEKNWARDIWHLTNRIYRKLLSYVMALFLCRQIGEMGADIDAVLGV